MKPMTAIVFCVLAGIGLLAWLDVRAEFRRLRRERDAVVERVAAPQNDLKARLDRIEALILRIQREGDGDDDAR